MGRARRTQHRALTSAATAADFLWLLRCDEANVFDNFTDAMAVRTMIAGGSGAAAAFSPFLDSSQAAGRGARDFDGAGSYAIRAGADGDESIFQSRVWGWAGWFRIDTLNNARVLEYGEHSAAGAGVSNVQHSTILRSDGEIEIRAQTTAGGQVGQVTSGAGLVAGQVRCIGVSCEPDPDNHKKQRQKVWLDGACIAIFNNVLPPDGGSAAKWIVGASRRQGTGVGTPGAFFDGLIDDIVFTKFTPTASFFREMYANGVCEFYERGDESAIDGAGTLMEVHHRVLVETNDRGDGLGTNDIALPGMVDIADLDLCNVAGMGVDLVKSLRFGDSNEDQGPHAALELHPGFDFWSLSPNISISPLRFLFATRRHIKIEQAIVPVGTGREGAAPFFRVRFDGWAMSPQTAPASSTLTVLGPDAPLQGAWVEPAKDGGDQQFGSALGVAVETIAQQMIDRMDPARFEIIAKDALSTLGVSNPNGIDDSDAGNKVAALLFDDTVEHGHGRAHPIRTGDSCLVEGTTNYNGVYTCLTGVETSPQSVHFVEATGGGVAAEQVGTVSMVSRHSYRGGKPAIWCPTSPAWNLFPIPEASSKSVLAAMQGWLDEIGWLCRYRWDEVRSQFRLKVYDPRVLSSATWTAHPDRIYPPSSQAIKHDYQRTAGAVEYASATQLDSRGERTRYIVAYADLARNGDRYFFRVANTVKSLITASGPAQDELDTLKNDLGAEPSQNAELIVEAPPDSAVDISDPFYMAPENQTLGGEPAPLQMPRVNDMEVYGSVVGWEVDASVGRCRMTATIGGFGATYTGAASAVPERHLKGRIAPIGTQKGIGLSPPNAPSAPTVKNLAAINGTRYIRASWAYPVGDLNRIWKFMEVHVSTSSSTFTPSASTLKDAEPGTHALVDHGVGVGVTAYVRIVAVDVHGNRSAPSTATSFVS
jgi:hypothetical protein